MKPTLSAPSSPVVRGTLLALVLAVPVAGAAGWWLRGLMDPRRLELARQRRSDRSREALALARDWLDEEPERALRHARRACRARTGEAYAVHGTCLYAMERYGQALWHHRRAQELASTAVAQMWQADNAIDAAKACWTLRLDADQGKAQELWDEAHEWLDLARRIDRDAVNIALDVTPWLAGLDREESPWLQR